jgi:hypothetical protein
VDEQDVSSLVQSYLSLYSWFQKVLNIEQACFVGLWLGILSSDSLYATVAEYYRKSGRSLEGHHDYHGKEYNRGGFFDWEKDAIANYFGDCKRLLVLGAGGGREVLALLRLGYQVDGFEANPNLVLAANELLREESFDPAVRLIARDEGPNTETAYDGIVVGWGMYMHIQTRKLRIAFLRQLRTQIKASCPILLSFSPRYGTPRQYYAGAIMANAIRRALRREPAAEVGDWLIPHYIHHFTQDEVVSELAEGGFDSVHYSTVDYAHAVGVAV